MTTILITFLVALGLSLLLTPLAGKFGKRFGAVDVPNDRKIHATVMPRTGGLAIFVTFLVVLVIAKLWKTEITNLFILDQEILFFLCGALIAFGIGFVDDFHRINAGVKFLFHVAAASVAFFGGLKIGTIGIFGSSFVSGSFSYVLTVFWFVILINAINLVDGMDGLAGGIIVFACIVIVILNILRAEYFTAILFSALGGATLGFLRYNFNPATIFLGDGGSYFLGYAVAGLSIMSSAKTQIGAILLIPVLALGVPIFDAILAPVRRFVRGKKMFSPDNGHIHHRLMEMGLTTKRVVWTLYSISCALCIAAVIVVNLRDEKAGLFLVVLGVGAVFFVRKLRYFEYFGSDKIYGWLRDITDVAGLSRERRSFLNVQMDMSASKSLDGLWENTIRGVDMLQFDMVEMALPGTRDRGQRSEVIDPQIIPVRSSGPIPVPFSEAMGQAGQAQITQIRKKGQKVFQEGIEAKGGCKGLDLAGGDVGQGGERRSKNDWQRRWIRDGFDGEIDICRECMLKLELPLLKEDGHNLGTLWLAKDLKRDSISHYTLQRVEHLRRTLINTVEKLAKTG